MSRKGPAKKRQLLPDPIYGSTVVAQLINKILLDGKKAIAEDIVYSALDIVKEKTEQEPVAVLKRALDNIRPALRFVPAESAAQPTRFPSRLSLLAQILFHCAGLPISAVFAAKRQCPSVWQTRFSMLPTVWVRP